MGDVIVTVCTTTAANQEAIKRVGGRELSFSFACAFGDFACSVAEQMSASLAMIVTGALSWAISNTGFNTSSFLWDTATSEWSWWQGAVLLVILGSGIWAIAAAVISGERSELVGAVVRLVAALPVSMASLWLIGTVLNIIDDLVKPLIDRGGTGTGLYDMVQNMIFGGGGGNWALATLTLTLLMIGTIVLMVVFSFRNLALAALVAMGPIAFMLFPMKLGRQWVARYAAAVLSLLLTTPLTIGFLMLILRGIGTVDSMWSLQAIPLGIGLLLVGFAPLAVFGLFSFIGESVGDGAGRQAGQTAATAGRSAMRKIGEVGRVGAGRSPVAGSAGVAGRASRPSDAGRPGSTGKAPVGRPATNTASSSKAGPPALAPPRPVTPRTAPAPTAAGTQSVGRQ